jgi:hypothetical protein
MKKLNYKCGATSALKKVAPGCPINDRWGIGIHLHQTRNLKNSAKNDFGTSSCSRNFLNQGLHRPALHGAVVAVHNRMADETSGSRFARVSPDLALSSGVRALWPCNASPRKSLKASAILLLHGHEIPPELFRMTYQLSPEARAKLSRDSRPTGDSKISFVQFGSHSPLLATVVPDGQFG